MIATVGNTQEQFALCGRKRLTLCGRTCEVLLFPRELTIFLELLIELVMELIPAFGELLQFVNPESSGLDSDDVPLKLRSRSCGPLRLTKIHLRRPLVLRKAADPHHANHHRQLRRRQIRPDIANKMSEEFRVEIVARAPCAGHRSNLRPGR